MGDLLSEQTWLKGFIQSNSCGVKWKIGLATSGNVPLNNYDFVQGAGTVLD
jgi:hypothetical protein